MPPEVYPVSQVTRYLRELLENNRHLTEVWVAGEISNLTRAASGHIYFTLKDERGALRCAFFRNRNIGQRMPLAEGLSVVVYGSLSLYEQRGDLSFVVDFVQPEGTGSLAAEFARLRDRFEAEGLFALERKRRLPAFPQRVGVVTSSTGAVWHDICDVLGRRWPLATLVLQPTPVQGEGASPSIAEAIRSVVQHNVDLVIVARGGGSAEDLWAFNEEPVIRAIFGCPVPVVSAVGHETDNTLADLVADVRAPTPSAAAELVAPDRAAVGRHVSVLQTQITVTATRNVARASEGVEAQQRHLVRALPAVAALQQRVRERGLALTRAVRSHREHAMVGVASQQARVAALSPLATLERGYALVVREDGSVATSAAALAGGERVSLRLRDGSRDARIEGLL
ncbi:MAG: exodeoxyribonuclease VII large subunit [Chloroflexi bacterium]|nr:MAG: exodeoxyribonuclease VII large subunit [Chloroflexota bacterium]